MGGGGGGGGVGFKNSDRPSGEACYGADGGAGAAGGSGVGDVSNSSSGKTCLTTPPWSI